MRTPVREKEKKRRETRDIVTPTRGASVELRPCVLYHHTNTPNRAPRRPAAVARETAPPSPSPRALFHLFLVFTVSSRRRAARRVPTAAVCLDNPAPAFLSPPMVAVRSAPGVPGVSSRSARPSPRPSPRSAPSTASSSESDRCEGVSSSDDSASLLLCFHVPPSIGASSQYRDRLFAVSLLHSWIARPRWSRHRCKHSYAVGRRLLSSFVQSSARRSTNARSSSPTLSRVDSRSCARSCLHITPYP